MIIRSRNKEPLFIYCEKTYIKHLDPDVCNTFILVDTSEFQSVSQAAFCIEARFPPERRALNLVQVVLLVKKIQLSSNPHLEQMLVKLAAQGLNWYIADTCGIGPLPPSPVDLDIFRQKFVNKSFKNVLGLNPPIIRKRTKVGL